MNSERFIREFCTVDTNGKPVDILIHPEDLKEYNAYMQNPNDETVKIVLAMQECELENYFSVGSGNDLDILKRNIRKLRGLE